MTIRFAKDKEATQKIINAIKKNDGYCPCRLTKTEDTICICKEFRDAPAGETCHCGLYYKTEE